jgi:glycosyltransferase involved in cell wall biosynthesis
MSKRIVFIIPSIKNRILTLDSLKRCPIAHGVVISRKKGIAHARNYGAKKAGSGLLVFLDDDLILKDDFWEYVNNTQKGEFSMTFLSGFPCSRVLVIHSEDFWSIGGFDEHIQFTGEDRDFYVRAIDFGLKFKPIPMNVTIHEEHEKREKNIYVAMGGVKENVIFILKYGARHKEVFKVDFLDRFKKGQIRTLLLQLIYFYYYLFKGVPY